MQSDRKLKFVRKFMKMAQTVANDNGACHSRHIGCIIADLDFRIIGMGYNGPPARTPHCDSYEYLMNFFIPQLSYTEQEYCGIGKQDTLTLQTPEKWAAERHNCGKCPRRFIKAGAGERSTLCSCQHAERNAITNASADLRDAMIFCWCGVPCIDCAGAIINSGIKEVHCIIAPDYHPVSRWLLKRGGVELFEYDEIYFQ